MEKSSMSKLVDTDNLITPVYLNQRVLFDMVAMLQGGIAAVSTVKRTEEQTKANGQKASASFGLSDAFSTLLKIGLSGEKASRNADSARVEQSEERVHTPASLFFTLRNLLAERSILKVASENWQPTAGDIVEVPLRLKRNPVLETVGMLDPLLKLAKVFDAPSEKQNNKKGAVQATDYSQIEKQLSALVSDLRLGGTVDLVATIPESSLNVVVTAETDYLRDPSMSDIVDGDYRVVGKVIFSSSHEDNSLNLLRKTSFARLPQMIDLFGKSLALWSVQHNVVVPDFVTEVKAPFVQIIPVAIFA
jgi:hypothetical protein